MSDSPQDSYQPLSYVRPNQAYVCGRSSAACEHGPRADGSCPMSESTCTPKLKLKHMRAWVSAVLVLVVLLVLIIGVNPWTQGAIQSIAMDAGPLSSVHAGFTTQDGCTSCHSHANHQGFSWLASAFTSGDTSQKCVACHRFEGAPQSAHNLTKIKTAAYQSFNLQTTVACSSCHIEHKGTNTSLKLVSDQACASCHNPKVGNFAKDHPAFSNSFALAKPGVIFYDHAAHSQDYFVNPKHLNASGRDPKLAAMAKANCSTCHAVNPDNRELSLKSYDKVCAGCHQKQIKERELVLFEPERLTPAAAFALSLSSDGDEEINSAAMKKLWRNMATQGSSALHGLGTAEQFGGLSTELVRKTGATWARGGDLDTLDDPNQAGWSAGENSEGNPALFYRANTHTDPVLKAWFETLRLATVSKDAERRSLAKEAMTEFLDKQTGPGACGKCHAAGLRATSDGKSVPNWSYIITPDKSVSTSAKTTGFSKPYNHAKHLSLGDPGATCQTCHSFAADSSYPKYFTPKSVPPESYSSNFSRIDQQNCASCHRPGKVNDSCQLCHIYHSPQSLNVGFKLKELPSP